MKIPNFPKCTVQELDISQGSIFTILHDELHLKSLCDKWIPKELNKNSTVYVAFANTFLDFLDSGFPLTHIIYTDEKWFLLRSIGSKQTNKVWVRSSIDKRNSASLPVWPQMSCCLRCYTWWFILLRNRSTKWVSDRRILRAIPAEHASKVLASEGAQWLAQRNFDPRQCLPACRQLGQRFHSTERDHSLSTITLFPWLQFGRCVAFRKAGNHAPQ